MAHRSVQRLNERELEAGISVDASWHSQYGDTAYIFFGSLPFQLTEGDILIIFSQYGIPVHMKLVRDKDTGKSKGFGWLKYEDQRSTILAVDNLNGTKILDRTIKVDHAYYEEKERDEEYEGLLNEELKNDFADVTETQEEESKSSSKDDEFADPLLLMQKLDTDKDKSKKDHKHRHRSSRHHHLNKHRSRSRSRSRDRHHRHRDEDRKYSLSRDENPNDQKTQKSD